MKFFKLTIISSALLIAGSVFAQDKPFQSSIAESLKNEQFIPPEKTQAQAFEQKERLLYYIYQRINPKIQYFHQFVPFMFHNSNSGKYLSNTGIILSSDLKDGQFLNFWNKPVELDVQNVQGKESYVIVYKGVNKYDCKEEIEILPDHLYLSINSRKNVKLKEEITEDFIDENCHLIQNDLYLYVPRENKDKN